jgi:hypothetical protein
MNAKTRPESEVWSRFCVWCFSQQARHKVILRAHTLDGLLAQRGERRPRPYLLGQSVTEYEPYVLAHGWRTTDRSILNFQTQTSSGLWCHLGIGHVTSGQVRCIIFQKPESAYLRPAACSRRPGHRPRAVMMIPGSPAHSAPGPFRGTRERAEASFRRRSNVTGTLKASGNAHRLGAGMLHCKWFMLPMTLDMPDEGTR